MAEKKSCKTCRWASDDWGAVFWCYELFMNKKADDYCPEWEAVKRFNPEEANVEG